MSVLVREILESHNATLIFLIKAVILQTIVILKKITVNISVNVIH